MNRTFFKILSWVVTLAVPVAVAVAAVRIVISPWVVEFEYRTPGFPDDSYGFTRTERLQYSKVAIDYLVNSADISFLGDLHFSNGQETPPFTCRTMDDCTRMYNDRELEHMVDVKNTVQAALKAWYLSLALLLGLAVWAWRGGWSDLYRQGLSRGGWLTVILIVGVVLIVAVSFNWIFVIFHEIFFSAGTWTFPTSDTLIRLFPERFWRDIFLIVGLIALALGAGLGWLFRTKKARKLSTEQGETL